MAELNKYVLDNYRQQFPELQGQDDTSVANHMHQQFYSNLPAQDVYTKLGLQDRPQSALEQAGIPVPQGVTDAAEKVGEQVAGFGVGIHKTVSDVASLGLRGLSALGITDPNTVNDFNKAQGEKQKDEENIVGKHPTAEVLGGALPYMLTPQLRVFGGLGETAGMLGQSLGKAVDFMGSGAAAGGLAGAATASGRGEDIGEGAKTGAAIGGIATGVGGAVASQANRLFNGKAIQGAIQDIKELSQNYLGLGGDIGQKLAQESADRFTAKGLLLKQAGQLGDQQIQLVPQSQLVKSLKPMIAQLQAQGADRAANLLEGELDKISGQAYSNGMKFSDLVALGSRLEKAASGGGAMTADKAGLQQASQLVNNFTDSMVSRTSMNQVPFGQQSLQDTWQKAKSIDTSTIPNDPKQVLAVVRGTNAQASQQLYSSVSPELQKMVKGQVIMDALNAATKNNTINPSLLQRELSKPGTVPWFQNPQDKAAIQGLQNLMNTHALNVSNAPRGDLLGGAGHWSLALGLLENVRQLATTGTLDLKSLLPAIGIMSFHGGMAKLIRSQGGMDFLAANATVPPGSPAAQQMYNEFLKRYGGSFVSAVKQEGQPPQARQQQQQGQGRTLRSLIQ